MSRAHLGRQVSALIDGQLDAARAEQAHAHLVVCGQCRDLVRAERAARQAIRGVAAASADRSLADRLVTIPDLPQPPAPSPPAPRAPIRSAVLVGALACLGVFAASLFVLGGQYRPGHAPGDILATGAPLQLSAPVAPVQTGDAQHSSTLLQWARAGGWVSPDRLPSSTVATGAHLHTDAETGARTLRLDLDRDGGRITVLEQPGHLDPVALAALEPVRIGGHDVYRINGHWWLLQCHDMVVAVSSGPDPTDAHAVIAAMPMGGVPPGEPEGIGERMLRGWRVLTD